MRDRGKQNLIPATHIILLCYVMPTRACPFVVYFDFGASLNASVGVSVGVSVGASFEASFEASFDASFGASFGATAFC